MTFCNNCPRKCQADRIQTLGFCGAPAEFRVARVACHMWEEPVISGTRGSGTIFFSGCNLRCIFCQNREISNGGLGKNVTPKELADLMLRLQDMGVHNINLVTPTPYAHALVPALERVKPQLSIPVVYNCGGYESADTLRALRGLVDIWLPDLKYFDGALSARYSSAPDYFPVAMAAIGEMLTQCPIPVMGNDGLMRSGVIVRHLVLPGARTDSMEVLRRLAATYGTSGYFLSLMSQYTPDFAANTPYKELHRRVTTFEYRAVLDLAVSLGFEGFLQDRSSASKSYTPDFREVTF